MEMEQTKKSQAKESKKNLVDHDHKHHRHAYYGDKRASDEAGASASIARIHLADNWLIQVVRWKHTAFPGVWMGVLFCTLLALLISYLVEIDALDHKDFELWMDFYSSHAIFTTFLVTSYLGYCVSAFTATVGVNRSVQGRIHDLMFLMTTHGGLTKDQVYHIRNLLLSACWACFGAIDDSVKEEAQEMIPSLLTEAEVTQAKLAGKGELISGGSTYGFLIMALQAIESFPNKADEGGVALWKAASRDMLIRLRATLGTNFDLDVDSAGLHLGYVHLVLINALCFLIITPFALEGSLGWFNAVGTFSIALGMISLLYLAQEMVSPFEGRIRVNCYGLLDEIAGAWPRYAAFTTEAANINQDQSANAEL